LVFAVVAVTPLLQGLGEVYSIQHFVMVDGFLCVLWWLY